jgi:hypothetical protein
MPQTTPDIGGTDDVNTDPAWSATARFLEGRVQAGMCVVAPEEFVPVVGPLSSPEPGTPPDWAVVSLQDPDTLPRPLLRLLLAETTPVYANDRYVVFARRPTFGLADMRSSPSVRMLGEYATSPVQPPAPRLPETGQPGGAQPPEAAMAPLTVPQAPSIPRATLPPEAAMAPLSVPQAPSIPRATLSPEAAMAPLSVPQAPSIPRATLPPEALGLSLPPRAALPTSLPPRPTVPPAEPVPPAAFEPPAGSPTPAPPPGTEPHLAKHPTAWGGLPARVAFMLGEGRGERVVTLGGAGLATAALAASALISEGSEALPELSFDRAILLPQGHEAATDLATKLALAARLLRSGGTALVVAENAASLGRRLAAALGRPPAPGGITEAAIRGALQAAGLMPLRLEGHSLDAWRATADAPPPGLSDTDPAAALLDEAGEAAGPRHAAWLLFLARKP